MIMVQNMNLHETCTCKILLVQKLMLHRFRLWFYFFVDDITFYRINTVCAPSYSLVMPNWSYWSSYITWRQNNVYICRQTNCQSFDLIAFNFHEVIWEVIGDGVFGRTQIHNKEWPQRKTLECLHCLEGTSNKKWDCGSVWWLIKKFKEMGTVDRNKRIRAASHSNHWHKLKRSFCSLS